MRSLRRLALALTAAALFAACDSGGDSATSAGAPAAPAVEEKLETLIPSLVDAIQAKQPVFVMDHVATSFKEAGGLDYYDVRSLVEKYALVDQPIGARLEGASLTPESDGRLRVDARVAFAYGHRLAAGEPLPEGGVVYAFEIVFAKNGPRWQAVGGSYKRVSPPATAPATPATTTG
jgi:hypothetical protein